MNPLDFVRRWQFDLPSALLALVAAPLGILLIKILVKHLKAWLTYLLEGFFYWISRFVLHWLAARLSLRRYCKLQLLKQNRYLYVPSTHDVKLEVDSVFVTLTLESRIGKTTAYTHRNLTEAGNRVRVIGDPGSGKSSLVKRIFRDSCRAALSKPAKSPLPILVELKNLAVPTSVSDGDLGSWFYDTLRSTCDSDGVYRMADCFDSCAQTAGLLVLLDGLDEVASSEFPRIQGAINGLGALLDGLSPSNVIVLTMRTQFHQQIRDAFRETFGPVLSIRPFSPTDIYDFLSYWPFAADPQEHISQIYKSLTDQPTLRDMCRNPLVLAMYVADRLASPSLVALESRTEFYGKVTDELLIRRRQRQVGPAQASAKMREQRQRILGRLAYEHLLDISQPSNSLSWVAAIRVTQEVMRCRPEIAEATFRDVARETGLVTEERPNDTFRFIHLTFCEFLAAYEAVQGQPEGWMTIVSAHRGFRELALFQARSRLLEVIPFACGLIPRVARSDAIAAVAALADRSLLARCFLETKAYEHPLWSEFTTAAAQELLGTPENGWDEKWLAELHLFNVVVRDANQCLPYTPGAVRAIDLAEFYGKLVAKQQNSLATLLSSYAAQDAAAAFRLAEVCGLDMAAQFPGVVIRNCDQAPFLGLVIEQAVKEPARVAEWAALLAESGLRSRLVATSMHSMVPDQRLSSYVQAVPPRMSWMRNGFASDSFYMQVLSVAASSSSRPAVCPILELVRTFPAPPAAPWKRLLYGSWIGSVFGQVVPAVFMLGIMLSLVLSKNPAVRSHVRLPALVAILVLEAHGISFSRRTNGWRAFYRQLLNLSPRAPEWETTDSPRPVVAAHDSPESLPLLVKIALKITPTVLFRGLFTSKERRLLARLAEARGVDGGFGPMPGQSEQLGRRK